MILLNPEKYTSPGEWLKDMRSQGYAVPLSMMCGVTKLMKKYGITFGEAFDFLAKHDKVMLVGRSFIYDLTGDNL
jgi:hypothetical protein